MKLKLLGLGFALLLMGCQPKTVEDRNARHPVSVKTHVVTESEENPMASSAPVQPIEHGSFTLKLDGQLLYVDPMEDSSHFEKLPKADMILVSFDHPNYIVPTAMKSLVKDETQIIVPASLQKTLPEDLKEKSVVISPGKDSTVRNVDFRILEKTEVLENQLVKQNNGVIIQTEKYKIFVSGDNGSLKELPKLEGIDIALIQMNVKDSLALATTIDEILKIKPKQVIPYYYQSSFSYSYVARLKKKVEEQNPAIEVKILDWYRSGGDNATQ